MNIVIRKKKIEDVEKCIDINIKEWWSTYKRLIPDDVISKLQVKDQNRIDNAIKTVKEKNNTFVAEVNGEVVGFSSYGKSRDENYSNSGEIYSCYVLDEYHGMKIGRMLADKAMGELIKGGYKTMITKCLVGNPFNEWHKALNGVFAGETTTNILGYEFNENVYYHEDIHQTYESNKEKIKGSVTIK